MISRASFLSLLGAILLAICLQGCAQTCGNQRTCGDCISTPNCTWCTDMNFNGTTRCSLVNTTSCTLSENPSGSVGAQTRNSGEDNPLNLTNVDLNLRVGEEQTFPVQITALRNLPLDLYILMDLSSSMGPVLESIQAVAGQITVRILNITNNVQLGFGSFNDKNLVPFTNPEFTTDPGQSPYAFLHRIDFTDNTTSFGIGINASITTSNADSAENTLEALAQVISCDSLLGWRSRNNTQVARLILVLTDQGFHYSGEGKLAGILNPYEGQCLLDRIPGMEQIELFRYDEFDYPSVGQIVDLIRSQEINVIFSVDSNLQPTYEALASLTNGRATVAELGGGVEILNTIAEEYERLLRAISLELLDPSDQYTIKITPTCPPGSTLLDDGTGCNGVQLDDQVLFAVSVILNSCDGLNNGESRVLRFESRAFGTFSVTVRGVCQCDCEEDEVPDAFQCSRNGVFSCGVCVCNEGYCGSNCSLVVDPNTGVGANNCPLGVGLFQDLICSGRGDCDCVCDCDVGTSGPACECDDTAALPSSEQCRSAENEVCSGPSRGRCCNQMCMCLNSPLGNPYRGNDTQSLCQCEPIEEVCNYNGEECNGQGTCLCDGCICDSEWSGDFCEILRSARCVGETIDTDCISQCRIMDGTPEMCDVPMCNENRPTLFVRTADIQINTETAVEQFANRILNPTRDFMIEIMCMATINGCINNYYILDNNITTAVVVETEIECPVPGLLIPAYAIAIISLGVLILLGILIIIIVKIIFVILDYVEVQRWRREAGEADFSKNQNPLYQSPEMQYTNVAYGKAL